MKTIVCAVLILSCIHLWADNYDMGVVAKIVDEDGRPIPRAEVSIDCVVSYMTEPSHRFDGLSGEDGCFKAFSRTSGTIGITAKKDGYYDSLVLEKFFKNRDENFIRPYDPSLQPIVLMMRMRLNPIPMYARHVELELPREGADMPYDLQAGDWLPPAGTGAVADVVFNAQRTLGTNCEHEVDFALNFPGQQNGLIKILADSSRGSRLRLPNHAPDDGYVSHITNHMGWSGQGGYFGYEHDDSNINYFMRVRAEETSEGITNAWYGKVHGPFKLLGACRDKMRIEFTYYLNPAPNDRNVEFDPERNLFTDLKSSEEVWKP